MKRSPSHLGGHWTLTNFLYKLAYGLEGAQVQVQQLKLGVGKLLLEVMRQILRPFIHRSARQHHICTTSRQLLAHLTSYSPVGPGNYEPPATMIRLAQVLFAGRVIS